MKTDVLELDEDLDPTETVTLDISQTLATLRTGGSLERRFTLGEELGRGGMGTVRAGIDRHLGRSVALKVMHESLVDSAPLVSRFLLEAQLAAQLEHPNILPLYTLERDALNRPAFAMKRVEGQTYHEYLWSCTRESQKGPIESGPMSLGARIEPLIKICDALAYAHKRGVIHRDVKPANIMLAKDGEVYLMDWGLARVVDDPREDVLPEVDIKSSNPHDTRPGQVIGTPSYMAPEQARAENPTLTGAVDQFSMGLTLFEAMTLKVARNATDDAVARRQARDAVVPKPVHRFSEPLPPRLIAIMQRATMMRAEDRYPSMAHMGEDLRRFLADQPLLTLPEPLSRRVSRAVVERPARALIALVLVTIAAAVGALTGLGVALSAERRTHRTADDVARLQAAARAGSHALDEELVTGITILESIAGSALALVSDGTPSGVRLPYTMDAFARGEYADELAFDPVHKHRVSWRRPLYYVPPGEPGFAAPIRRMQLAAFDTIMPALFAEAGPSPIFRAYVTLADGLLVQYPAYGEITPGYEPRLRPYYREAVGTHGRRFRQPFLHWDAKVMLLPCNVALYANDGRFIGVAGVDVSLPGLLPLLTSEGVEGWRSTRILDADANVLADSSVGAVTRLPAERIDVPEIVALVRAGEPSAVLEMEGRKYALDRVESVGWYYLIEVER